MDWKRLVPVGKVACRDTNAGWDRTEACAQSPITESPRPEPEGPSGKLKLPLASMAS